LKASIGETIAVSEAYETKTSAKNGVESVKKNAPSAEVVDLTLPIPPGACGHGH
jgi:uncharacterized protein